jgi:hypothetical protein
MKEITINLNDDGWEMLVNGVPSPRFARYMQNLRWIRAWATTLADVFVLGPGRSLAFGVTLLLVTGQMSIGGAASSNLREAQITFHLAPSKYSVLAGCTSDQHPCPMDEARSAAEARDIKAVLLVVYLAGVGFTLERRWRCRQERR